MSRNYAKYDSVSWYRFSCVHPPADGEYIVTCRNARRATILTFENRKWTNDRGKTFDVIAWTFLPGIYRPEE